MYYREECLVWSTHIVGAFCGRSLSGMLTFMLINLLTRNRKVVYMCVLLYMYKQNYNYLKTVHSSADMY